MAEAVFNRQRYVTVRQYAEMSGFNYRALLKLAKTKGFPSFRPHTNANYLIDTERVQEWLDIQSKRPKK